jgi:leucyl-tRNA synthetase
LRIYAATSFPEWQDACVQIIKGAYDEQSDKVDAVKVKELLAQKGLIKDKNVMPFIQAFKVMSHSYVSGYY